MAKKNKYTGKFIIVWDTICDGWECAKDERGNPTLFPDRDEAIREIFDDALSMLSNRSTEELEEYNEGITPEIISKMKEIDESQNVQAMEKFFQEYPSANDNEEFVVPAHDYIQNRKAIFTGRGLVITGKKLS